MKDYTRSHIIKHALEHYIQREGASVTDTLQELKVLAEVKESIERMKHEYGIKSGEGTE